MQHRVLTSNLLRLNSLHVSISLQQVTLSFYQDFARSLVSMTNTDGISSIVTLLLDPYEREVQRYAVLEKDQLLGVVNRVCLDPQSEETESENVASMITWVSSSVSTVFDAIEGALQQCIQFTGDSDSHLCECDKDLPHCFSDFVHCILSTACQCVQVVLSFPHFFQLLNL